MIKVYIIESSNAAAIAAAGDGSQSRLQVGLHWFQMVFGYFGGVFLFFPLFFACVFVFPLNSGVSLTFSWTHSVIHFFDPTWFPIQNEQWKKGIILPYMGIVSEAIYKFPYKQPGFPMESICKARTPRFFWTLAIFWVPGHLQQSQVDFQQRSFTLILGLLTSTSRPTQGRRPTHQVTTRVNLPKGLPREETGVVYTFFFFFCC